jgi:hypothetical protein
MSRSGYTDDCEDQWATIRWRGAVKQAIKGKRGQAFLRETLAALDAMPERSLVTQAFEADGEFCTLGVVCKARGVAMPEVDPDEGYQDDCSDEIAHALGISQALAAEIMWLNDEHVDDARWVSAPTLEPSEGQSWRYRVKSVRIPVPDAAEQRWQYMRNWVARQIKEIDDE